MPSFSITRRDRVLPGVVIETSSARPSLSKAKASAARAPQTFVVFFTAKAESFWYAPGVALRSARARSESSLCAASASGVSAATCGAEVSGLQPVWHGGDLGFFDFGWCLEDCATAPNAMPHDIKRGMDAGFFRYLTKPIKVNEFMDTLDLALKFAKTELARAVKEQKS